MTLFLFIRPLLEVCKIGLVNVVGLLFLDILQSLVFMQNYFNGNANFSTQNVIMKLGGRRGRGVSLRTFSNSEKLSNFKAHELSRNVN